MNGPLSRFLSAFTLLSRLPCRAAFTPDYSRADFWIPALSPLVSLAAALGGAAGWLATGDALLAAISAMAVQYLAFNLFHVDGLLDTADAMACFAGPERRLEILKDSRIGSYAFSFGLLVLGAKLALLAALFRQGLPVAACAVLAAPAAGRLACAFVPLVSRPARPGGLGALMAGFSPLRLALGCIVAACPLAAACAFPLALALPGSPGPGRGLELGLAALASLVTAGLGSGAALARLYRRRVGGFTGDALGAAVEIGELACLLLFATILHLGPLFGLFQVTR